MDIGVDDSFEELVRSILDHKLAEYAKEPTDSQDLARALAEALVQHGVRLRDPAAFTRFVLPEVALFAKTKMQGFPFDSENFVHVLVEMIPALAEDESLKIENFISGLKNEKDKRTAKEVRDTCPASFDIFTIAVAIALAK